MRALRDNAHAYRLAHQLIWRGKIWRVMIIPVLMTMVYLPLVIVGGLALGEGFSEWMVSLFPWLANYSGWIHWMMRVLVFFLFALFGYFTFRIVVMLFYLPFLDFVSDRVERRVLGRPAEDPKRWHQMIGRILLIAVITILLTGLLLMLNLAASLIPVVGTIVAMVCILPFQFFLTGLGYIDPYFDRNGISVGESLGLLWRRFATVVVFDLFGTGLLLIPLIGWFLGPTYSVVAGVILGIRLQQADSGSIDLLQSINSPGSEVPDKKVQSSPGAPQ